MNKTENKKMRALTEGAVMVALAFVLNLLKLMHLPQGGSITINMLPILFYCFRWGWKDGFKVSFAYGILEVLMDGAYAWGPTSIIFDYLLAYGILGVAGFFKGDKKGVVIGSIVAAFGRFLSSFISGVTIYKITMPTEIFNVTIANPYLYSAVYNGSYIVIDTALCLIVMLALYKPMKKYFLGEDIK